MIQGLQMDQGKVENMETDFGDTPQSFEEICEEEIRRFEEEARKRKSWRMCTEDNSGESDYEDAEESFE